jgi:hypothetical protein
MAQVKETAKKKACLELLVARELKSDLEQVSEESAPEELATEALVSKHVGQGGSWPLKGKKASGKNILTL